MSLTVKDNAEENRYEALDESGVVAGFAQYLRQGDRIVFVHTEVDGAFEGEGVGSTLVRAALDDVRGAGLRVTARCEFVKAYIERHPEYGDLVA